MTSASSASRPTARRSLLLSPRRPKVGDPRFSKIFQNFAPQLPEMEGESSKSKFQVKRKKVFYITCSSCRKSALWQASGFNAALRDGLGEIFCRKQEL